MIERKCCLRLRMRHLINKKYLSIGRCFYQKNKFKLPERNGAKPKIILGLFHLSNLADTTFNLLSYVSIF